MCDLLISQTQTFILNHFLVSSPYLEVLIKGGPQLWEAPVTKDLVELGFIRAPLLLPSIKQFLCLLVSLLHVCWSLLTIALHAMWCHVMPCKLTGAYVHSWLSFVTVPNWMSFHWVFWLCVHETMQPFVMDWAHACCEIHKKWWVYTARFVWALPQEMFNDTKCNQNICKVILVIYPEVTCGITTFKAPYLWTSDKGRAHTCCVDTWITNLQSAYEPCL